jgi:hypothetical protein
MQVRPLTTEFFLVSGSLQAVCSATDAERTSSALRSWTWCARGVNSERAAAEEVMCGTWRPKYVSWSKSMLTIMVRSWEYHLPWRVHNTYYNFRDNIIVIRMCIHNLTQEETHNCVVIMTSTLFHWYLFNSNISRASLSTGLYNNKALL